MGSDDGRRTGEHIDRIQTSTRDLAETCARLEPKTINTAAGAAIPLGS